MNLARPTLGLLLSALIGCTAPPVAAEQPVDAKQWCIVNEEKLVELSGLAPYLGEAEEPFFWAHNDGTSSKLYLLDSAGDTRAVLDIRGIEPVDCEELCSFQSGERRYLLLADTGDNNRRRKSCKLYLIMEPSLAEFADAADGKKKKKKEKPHELQVKPVATYEFAYPDGARNCEAVGIDPKSQTILFVTKEKDPGCEVFSLPLHVDPNGHILEHEKIQQAKPLAKIQVPTITGLAFSSAGDHLVLLGRGQLFEFTRPKTPATDVSEPFVRMLKAGPRPLTKPKQEQGEAVCFSRDGKKLYVASEGKNQPIWELELTK